MKKFLVFIMAAMFTVILAARPPGEVTKVKNSVDVELSQDIQHDFEFTAQDNINVLTNVEVEISPGDYSTANFIQEGSNELSASMSVEAVNYMNHTNTFDALYDKGRHILFTNIMLLSTKVIVIFKYF